MLEVEKWEEGLNFVILSDNKGFVMFLKMGYKLGMVIGKKGEGCLEFVFIELKFGRGGLGRDNEVKRKLEDFCVKLI